MKPQLLLWMIICLPVIANAQVDATHGFYMNDPNLTLINDEFIEEIVTEWVSSTQEDIYIVGYSGSPPFTQTYDYCGVTKYLGNGDGFVAKYRLNPVTNVLSLAWLRYLGAPGTEGDLSDDRYDWGYCLAVSHIGTATYVYVGGTSMANDGSGEQTMPCATCNLDDNTEDDYTGFIARYDVNGTLDAFTYLGSWDGTGGAKKDMILGLAVKPVSPYDVYAVGYTEDDVPNLPTNTWDNTFNGTGDGYIVGYDNCLNNQVYFTYYSMTDVLPGPSERDRCHGIVFSANGNDMYVSGTTESISGIATLGTYDDSYNGGLDAFAGKWYLDVNKYKPSWGTYIGGTGNDRGRRLDISRPAFGITYVYMTLWAESVGMTTYGTPIHKKHADDNSKSDIFIAKMSGATGAPIWSTYFGGNHNDRPNGIDWFTSGIGTGLAVTGITESSDADSFIVEYTGGDKLKPAISGQKDAFYILLRDGGTAVSLGYATYLGGTAADEDYGPPDSCLYNNAFTGYGPYISTLQNGVAYVSFSTSSNNVPATLNAHDCTTIYNPGLAQWPACGTGHSNFEAFVLRLNLCSFPPTCPQMRMDSEPEYPFTFSVYPNPFEAQTNIRLQGSAGEVAEVSVIDLFGRILFSEKVSLSNGVAEITLDLSSFGSGAFIALIKTDKEMHYVSLIKQR